jgi:hypothetical protein
MSERSTSGTAQKHFEKETPGRDGSGRGKDHSDQVGNQDQEREEGGKLGEAVVKKPAGKKQPR